MLRPSVYKPEQHILKSVRQIWAMESTKTSRGKKKLIDAGFMFIFHAFFAKVDSVAAKIFLQACHVSPEWHSQITHFFLAWFVN